MHSHHSHSGQYISHAVDDLDTVVGRAAEMRFSQFCLTEHMPRFDDKYLYPEELAKGYTCADLERDFEAYTAHARQLQHQYSGSSTQLLVGFEVEGVDTKHIQYAASIKHKYDMCVGSVHHVFGIPIDFDEAAWKQARELTESKTSRELYSKYFELQHEVIETVKPEVIGHIDLIRLFHPKDEIDETTGKKVTQLDLEHDWPEVWAQLVRNIQLAASYGGLFELNSAAIRKGWDTPYPKLDVAQAIIKYGGARFCLSDDSHGLAQMGLNYRKVLSYVKDKLQLDRLYFLQGSQDQVRATSETLDWFESSEFWKVLP